MNFSSTSSKKGLYWGKITWILLHTFPKFLDDDFFNKNKTTILSLLHNICTSVPCPQCSKHAISSLKKYNYFHNTINNTVSQLERNIHKFHNQVNKMLNKDLYKETILQEYENIHFLEIYKSWTELYVIKGHNLKLMSHKNAVNKTRNEFIGFMNRHFKYFINKINGKKDTLIKTIVEQNNRNHLNSVNKTNNIIQSIALTKKGKQHIDMLNRKTLLRKGNRNTMDGFYLKS